ncbi:helicase-related protein [Cohnella sp. GCM10020058]|uniref:helicase-related protein n=1 Tax=Cohnella sp. GCM10020058 TaxID=3317330 RepID=UPI00363E1BB9
MRAIVYAVRLTAGWQVRFTVDWETDMAYWLDRGYREGLEEAWRHEGSGSSAVAGGETASMIVKMNRSLPLGEAEVGCGRIRAKLSRGEGDTRDAGAMERLLLRVFGEAAAARTLYGSRVGVPLPPSVGSGCEQLLPVPAGGMGRGAEARLQALRLRVIAPLLQGRSLLQAEAVALLAEHAPGITLGVGLAALVQLGALLGTLRLGAAVAAAAPRGASRQRGRLRCRRCGSGEAAMRRTACAACGNGACAVCEACLALGRSRACGLLVRGPAPAASPLGLGLAGAARPSAADICARWGLSPAQRVASEQAVRFLLAEREPGSEAPGRSPPSLSAVRAGRSIFRLRGLSATRSALEPTPPRDPMAIQPRSFLLWAVTGAGKTEMIFPLLDAVLSAGGRALLATPRRDVVLELAPRLAKAFPARSIAVLYGGSGERWQQAELTLATTHQLMRFGQAFDLVLIDELDAFPYHGDPMLHHAAASARKPDGSTVLLSATPPPALRRAVRFGRLPCARVPVRYHRHPLPVPRVMSMPPLHRWDVEAAAAAKKIPDLRRRLVDRQSAALFACLASSLARGAQVFVFVPYIKQIDALVSLFRRQAQAWGISPASVGGTSSQDEGRRDKVMAFRERELRLLVTTTILERGVTVPRSDVFILDAHAKLFDEAALVQMAGRAGRSSDDPAGRVYFCAAHRTRALIGAIRQVTAMNRLARNGGYLLDRQRDDRRVRLRIGPRAVLFKPSRRRGDSR